MRRDGVSRTSRAPLAGRTLRDPIDCGLSQRRPRKPYRRYGAPRS